MSGGIKVKKGKLKSHLGLAKGAKLPTDALKGIANQIKKTRPDIEQGAEHVLIARAFKANKSAKGVHFGRTKQKHLNAVISHIARSKVIRKKEAEKAATPKQRKIVPQLIPIDDDDDGHPSKPTPGQKTYQDAVAAIERRELEKLKRKKKQKIAN